MREEKGSKIKHIPPRVQLQLKSGWFSPVCVVNKPKHEQDVANKKLLWFDDVNVLDYETTRSINLPSGLPTISKWTASELTTSLKVVGITHETVADAFFLVSSSNSSAFTPFVDYGNPETDRNTQNPFYATGSLITEVGEGFDSPLWSKTRFEIPIVPSSDTSFGVRNYTSASSNNFLMAYWNKDLGRYEGVGTGKEFAVYSGTSPNDLKRFLGEQAIGFGSCLDGSSIAVASASYLVSNPITNFGFPNSAIYETTSSCLISVSDYITEPFLLEKVVVYFSGALNMMGYSFGSLANITTFFILNQRSAYIKQLDVTSTYNSASVSLQPLVSSSFGLTTTRDLVTWVQVSKLGDSGEPAYDLGLLREFNYTSISGGAPLRRQFSTQLVVSGNMKSALKYDQGYNNLANITTDVDRRTAEYAEACLFSGRNLIGDNGRSFVNPVAEPRVIGTASFGSEWASAQTRNINEKYSRNNLYLLMPTDKLIFGWQLPYYNITFNETITGLPVYNQSGPSLTGSVNGINKVVFYGSYLRNNKEFHENLQPVVAADVLTTQELID